MTNKHLAERAATIARRHAPRTPERRAAAALWSALSTTHTLAAARAALGEFTTPDTAADATALLHELRREAPDEQRH